MLPVASLLYAWMLYAWMLPFRCALLLGLCALGVQRVVQTSGAFYAAGFCAYPLNSIETVLKAKLCVGRH